MPRFAKTCAILGGNVDPYSYFRRRSPHGERGLKLGNYNTNQDSYRRSPHGERGLKFPACATLYAALAVAPHTGSVD